MLSLPQRPDKLALSGAPYGGAADLPLDTIPIDPTGDERWVLEGAGPSYSSPILMSFSGHEQIVIQVHRHILGVDPTSGRALWNVPFVTPCDQNIVTPLQAGGLVVVSSKDTGTLGIRVTRDAEDWLPRIEWHTNDVSMYMSSPVLFNGAVVGLSHRKRGQLFVLAPKTGAVRWQGVPGRGANAAFLQTGRRWIGHDASLPRRGEPHVCAPRPDGVRTTHQGRDRAVALRPLPDRFPRAHTPMNATACGALAKAGD